MKINKPCSNNIRNNHQDSKLPEPIHPQFPSGQQPPKNKATRYQEHMSSKPIMFKRRIPADKVSRFGTDLGTLSSGIAEW